MMNIEPLCSIAFLLSYRSDERENVYRNNQILTVTICNGVGLNISKINQLVFKIQGYLSPILYGGHSTFFWSNYFRKLKSLPL